MSIRLLILSGVLALATACSNPSPIGPNDDVTPSSNVATDKTVMVSGTVYADSASSDQPLTGATVVVTSADQTKTTVSTSRGFYSLSVPPGDATITASKTGYSSKTWDVHVGSDVIVNFSLSFE